MYCNAIYQLCRFIPNCTAIDQSNVDFTFCTARCAKSEIRIWLVNSTTAGARRLARRINVATTLY